MEELNKLKKKVENKKNKTAERDNIDYVKAIDNFRLDIKKVYEKVCRAEENLMKKMRYIDSKQNKILELLQKLLQNNNDIDVDVEELQKQKEIKELENKLRKLKDGE